MTATANTRTIRLSRDCQGMSVLPHDAGQIVEVSYGLLPDGYGGGELIRCTWDRSEGSGDDARSYEMADLDPDADSRFEPQNGLLPAHSPWEPCDEIGVMVIA